MKMCDGIRRRLMRANGETGASRLPARGRPFARAALTLLSLALALPAAAGGVYRADLRFEPSQPFVGQPFNLTIEVTVTPGLELDALQIEGLPDPSRAVFVNLRPVGRQEFRPAGGQAVDVIRYTAEGRAAKPFFANIACIIRAQASERVTSGWFSQLRSAPVTFRATPDDLDVRELPLPGRPADFSGAVGSFTLGVEAAPLTVAPGDLVTLTYTLSGSGWLADAGLGLPDPGDGFKAYPARRTVREETPPRIVMQQVVIPLSTNAAVVAAPRFAYFDPAAAAYRVATVEPVRLAFARIAAEEPSVRRISPAPVADAAGNGTGQPPDLALAETVAKLRQLLPLAASLILAAGIGAALFRVRRLPGILVGLAILALGVAVSRRLSRDAEARVLEVATSATARLAPSEQALALFDLHPGATVVPLEHAPGWIRVRSSGREAWIPLSCLRSPSPPKR